MRDQNIMVMDVSVETKQFLKSQILKWIATRAQDDMRELLCHELELGRFTHLEYCVKMERVYEFLHLTINSYHDDNLSAIMFALGRGNTGRYISSLVELGMDISYFNSKNQTCLHVAIVNDVKASVLRHLLDSISKRLPKYELNMLLNHTDNDGYTALYYALSRTRKEKYIKILIHAGVLLERGDKHGQTILHHAVACDVSAKIIEHIVKYGCNVNAVDERGRSAIFYINSIAMLKVLQKYGADVELRDIKGYGILEHFLEKHNKGEGVTRLLVMKFIQVLDSMNATPSYLATLPFACDDGFRAKLLWIKLRKIVRGQMFHFIRSKSRSYLLYCIRLCEIPLCDGKSYYQATERSLRNILRKFTFGAFDTSNAVNEYTLLQSPVADIPAEFAYTIRNNSALFAFDLRELVKLDANPYTKEPFTAEQKGALVSRLVIINRLRETPATGICDLAHNFGETEADTKLAKINRLHLDLPNLPCDFNVVSKCTVLRVAATASFLRDTLGDWTDFPLLEEYTYQDPRMDTDEMRHAYLVDMLYEIITQQPEARVSVNIVIDDVLMMENRISFIAEMGNVSESTIIKLTPLQEFTLLRCAYKFYVLQGYMLNVSEIAYKRDVSLAIQAHSRETGFYSKKGVFCSALEDILNKADLRDRPDVLQRLMQMMQQCAP